MFKRSNLVLLSAAAVIFCGCKSVSVSNQHCYSHFTGLTDFSNFDRLPGGDRETVLLSPEIKPPADWNELVVSWNAAAPGSYLKVEARATAPGHITKYYTLGLWSPDDRAFPRTSVSGQKDSDGDVKVDTLVLNRLAGAVQIRLTLGGTDGGPPSLKFLGLSFYNTKTAPVVSPPNRAAWGKIIPTPERSQEAYPGGNGWCSPASLSMALARWAEILDRPEMNCTVPGVAAAVYDHDFAGTGNWPFNTAFAGGFQGMRSYVTRLDDLSEVEDWIAAGIPVILSARWDWLQPGRPPDSDGHLIVCTGFTENGDVVFNDPAARLNKGELVRRIYKRADVIHAWTKSHNAVYLVYPENTKIPANRRGHW